MVGLAVGFFAMIVFAVVVGMSRWWLRRILGSTCVLDHNQPTARRGGTAWVMGPYTNALDAVVQPVGSGMFSHRSLIALAYFHWFSLEMRVLSDAGAGRGHEDGADSAAAPEGDVRGSAACDCGRDCGRLRRMLGGLVQIRRGIGEGGAVAHQLGPGSFNTASNYMLNQTRPDPSAVMAMVFGALVVFFLSAMRTRFIWFPFHPAGYVLANSGTMYWLWCPFPDRVAVQGDHHPLRGN